MPKEEGLPEDVVDRLKSYNTVKDVPFKVGHLSLGSSIRLALDGLIYKDAVMNYATFPHSIQVNILVW